MNKKNSIILILILLCGSTFVRGSEEKVVAENKQKMFEAGKVKEWRSRTWSNAYVYNTSYYSVKSNTSYQACCYVGNIMGLMY